VTRAVAEGPHRTRGVSQRSCLRHTGKVEVARPALGSEAPSAGRDVPSARDNLELEAAQAQGFAESLPVGRHKITSRMAEAGYNEKEENWNWYFATGGYVSWGKGEVAVRDTPTGREYEMDFVYKFYDRYNWDKGKKVNIIGIEVTDQFMGEFHRQGLAREFDCVGSVKRRLTWKHGQDLAPAQLRSSAGRA
jgi:hypothetical protein